MEEARLQGMLGQSNQMRHESGVRARRRTLKYARRMARRAKNSAYKARTSMASRVAVLSRQASLL